MGTTHNAGYRRGFAGLADWVKVIAVYLPTDYPMSHDSMESAKEWARRHGKMTDFEFIEREAK